MILLLAEDSQEMPSFVFSEKKKKKKRVSSDTILFDALRVTVHECCVILKFDTCKPN